MCQISSGGYHVSEIHACANARDAGRIARDCRAFRELPLHLGGMHVYFEPSLDALSLRSDVISSIKILSFFIKLTHTTASMEPCGEGGPDVIAPIEPALYCEPLGLPQQHPLAVCSFRAPSGRLKLTARRHTFNKDSLPSPCISPG